MNNLSKSMRQQWQEQGYLHLKNVIPKDEAAGYLDAANEVIAQYEAKYPKVREKGVYTIIQTLFRTSGIDGLMDHPNLFGTHPRPDGTLYPDHGLANLRALSK